MHVIKLHSLYGSFFVLFTLIKFGKRDPRQVYNKLREQMNCLHCSNNVVFPPACLDSFVWI